MKIDVWNNFSFFVVFWLFVCDFVFASLLFALISHLKSHHRRYESRFFGLFICFWTLIFVFVTLKYVSLPLNFVMIYKKMIQCQPFANALHSYRFPVLNTNSMYSLNKILIWTDIETKIEAQFGIGPTISCQCRIPVTH